MRVRVLLKEREVELPEGSTVRELLSALGLREGIVVVRERKILREEERLEEGDRLRILPVAIGG